MQLVKPHALDLGFSTIVLSRNRTLFIVHCGGIWRTKEETNRGFKTQKHQERNKVGKCSCHCISPKCLY